MREINLLASQMRASGVAHWIPFGSGVHGCVRRCSRALARLPEQNEESVPDRRFGQPSAPEEQVLCGMRSRNLRRSRVGRRATGSGQAVKKTQSGARGTIGTP